ncbi:MAG TPA: AAA family ATPase [Pseudomonadales bacterium]
MNNADNSAKKITGLAGPFQRRPAEQLYQHQLELLKQQALGPVPAGWRLSPRAVEKFLLGDPALGIERKFVADRAQVARIIIGLCTSRGAMLVGEPGTAKSLLSELLAAAISGDSTLSLQGAAISRVDQLLYGWNPSVLQQQGYSRQALVPSPLLRGMMEGKLVRFEELARCPQPLQDALLSVLSERVLVIPELAGDDSVIMARHGFNVIATSNSVDEGLHKISAAMKRRMDFEEIRPIARLPDELAVVMQQAERHNREAGIVVELAEPVVAVLVTLFHELRNGQTLDGRSTDRLADAALSTAEAVSVVHAASLNAWYYGDGIVSIEHIMQHLIGSALKDKADDRRRLRHYFDTAIASRQGEHWQQLWALRSLIGPG